MRRSLPISILLALTACAAPTEVRRGFIPYGEEPEGVEVRPVGSTPAEPEEGVIRCAVRYDGVAVCWQVVDSVSVSPR